ncbi:MAG: chaperone NapD [Alphaproteobacteria bacterium]|uniref:Chaperone NapD n=1 Tax=Candidatus Nitrobium versatile TaxID=2884831 RepID=A0A953M2Q1_9BACT|nr:chaperone NapD [Candidatus Nitrobium versatile]
MIFASGFVEANGIEEVGRVLDTLRERNIEVTDMKEEKLVFLIERETVGQVKEALESLKDIEGVRSVYLAYYSLEGGDRDQENIPFFDA